MLFHTEYSAVQLTRIGGGAEHMNEFSVSYVMSKRGVCKLSNVNVKGICVIPYYMRQPNDNCEILGTERA